MEKKNLSPLELLELADQHAYSANYLLQDNASDDHLAAFGSLMYIAFELLLKAYLLHDFKSHNHKTFSELLEHGSKLGLSKQDEHLLKRLAKQCSFRKGTEYELWEDRQAWHVFCAELSLLYKRLQNIMPIELQQDYQ